MKATLHVDLEWTDLEDFIEHLESALHGHSAIELLGYNTGLWLWDDEPYPTENPGFRGWELIDRGKYLRIRTFDIGTTGRNYWFLEGRKEGEKIQETLIAAYQVVRFRRGRLKVMVLEKENSDYGERLHEWLRPRWGDAIKELKEEDVPELPIKGTPGRRRDPWNERAIVRLLAGEDEHIVKADWRAEFEEETKQDLDQTSDGPERTWRKRVWEPYRTEVAK